MAIKSTFRHLAADPSRAEKLKLNIMKVKNRLTNCGFAGIDIKVRIDCRQMSCPPPTLLHVVEEQHCYHDRDINYGHAGTGLYIVDGLNQMPQCVRKLPSGKVRITAGHLNFYNCFPLDDNRTLRINTNCS